MVLSTLSHHPSLSAITLGKKASSVHLELLNVSFCWLTNTVVSMYRSLSLLLQQWPVRFAPLTRIVCEIGSKWLYNCCFAGCCFQDMFKTAHSILVLFLSCFFFRYFVKVGLVQPYNSTDMTTSLFIAWISLGKYFHKLFFVYFSFHLTPVWKRRDFESHRGLIFYHCFRCALFFAMVDCFVLVSLFNGISTFQWYLMTKPSLLKDSWGTI